MVCSICGGQVTGMVRTDPAHAECVKKAEARMRAGICGQCGVEPVVHDGRCADCQL